METSFISTGLRLLAAGVLALGLAVAGAGCGGRASAVCSADPSPSSDAVLIDLALDANADGTPFAIGANLTSANGLDYKVSMLRFYLSHVEMVDGSGVARPAVLADAGGVPLKYGVTLVDFANPESQLIHVLAPPGSYESVSVGVGVPRDCSGGVGILNHENASEQTPPLDVDSDMYWGWDPGYVHFKIEGRVNAPNGARSFAFHLGDDKRYTTVSIPAKVDVAAPTHHHLHLDINRLFVSPSGDPTPDMTGATTSNNVHGGVEADTLANNLKMSGVMSWND